MSFLVLIGCHILDVKNLDMALVVSTPEYAFTNSFPSLTVSGTANAGLILSIRMGDYNVLDSESYMFDNTGFAKIRGIGDLLEKYFYDANYDVRRFAQNAVFTFESGSEKITKTILVCFCRSYISGIVPTPDLFRKIPLTVCRIKHTLPDAKEYLSFVGTVGKSVQCTIGYVSSSSGELMEKIVEIYRFPSSDAYSTVDVSMGIIENLLVGVGTPVYWDVYISGFPEESVRYVADKPSSFSPTTFVFVNSFGGIESFVCRGICKDELSSERETGVLAGRAYITKQTFLRSYTVNTGTLDSSQKECLLSLLTSYSLFILRDNLAIPVIVSGQSVSMHNFRSKLPVAEFSFTRSDRNLTIYRYDKSKGIFDYTFDYSFE